MSTLKVTNIQATGETASRAVSGVAAAWCSFNQLSPSIRDSANTSSLTDTSTGKGDINWASAMGNTDYCSTATKETVSQNTTYAVTLCDSSTGLQRTASKWYFQSAYVSPTVSNWADPAYGSVTIHGDLA